MSLVLGADDHGGLNVIGTDIHFTLLAAIMVFVPDARRDEGAALLTYHIRR